MAELRDILYGVSLSAIEGDRAIDINSLAFDSRKVSEGSLFIAIEGLTVDGHTFIQKAISAGAKAILCQRFPETLIPDVTYVRTQNSQEALGIAASNFYGNPSSKIKLVGITGTNGKTTTATLAHSLFQQLGYKKQ